MIEIPLSLLLALWPLIALHLSLISHIHAITVVTDCTSLQAIQNNLHGEFLLGNDIDCSDTVNWNNGAGFEPLGNIDIAFNGTFNGQGHIISGLVVHRPNWNDVGLFGYFECSAQVNSVGLVGGFISGRYNVGGLVGYNNGGKLNNIYSTSSVNGTMNVGGLVGCHAGFIRNGAITNAYSTGAVTGYAYIGGLVGYQSTSSTVSSSYWDIETSKLSESAAGIGKTTAELYQQETFVDWDFTHIWSIIPGQDYPKLRNLNPPTSEEF